MQEMVLKRLKIIEDLTAEMNQLKETYDGMLEDDPIYQEIQEKDMEVKEEKREKKAKLMNNSSYSRAQEEIKEKRREIKENKEALSQELVEYYRNEGKLEVADHNGNVKRMKFSVRLVN